MVVCVSPAHISLFYPLCWSFHKCVGYNPFIKEFAVKANNLEIIELHAKVTASDHGETSIQIKFHLENQG